MPRQRIDPNRYAQPGMLGTIVGQVRLSWRLLSDPRVPLALKMIIPALMVIYVVSPIDLLPDFLIGLGQLDDIGVVLAALALFVRLAPSDVVNEHRDAMEGRPTATTREDVIDTDYTVGGQHQGSARR
jgi:uncharacterized membrane protein YkvA (DUF1232 family)